MNRAKRGPFLAWAPGSECEVARCRWPIESFFQQIKQILQLADFLGNSANAVRWQIRMALLCCVLLRYLAHASRWAVSDVWASPSRRGCRAAPARCGIAPPISPRIAPERAPGKS